MDNPEESLIQAANFLNRGDFVKAEPLARSATVNLPENADGWHILGLCLEKHPHQLRKAIRSLETAYNLRQSHRIRSSLTLALEKSGRLHMQQGNLPMAANDFERVLELDEKAAIAATYAGVCYLRMDDVGRGLKLLQQAVALNPSHAPAWTSLGTLHLKARRYTQASECFERALRLNPNDFNSLNNLAVLRATQIQHAAAKDLLVKATELSGPLRIPWHNRLYTSLYDAPDPKSVADQHVEWGALVRQQLGKPHTLGPVPKKRQNNRPLTVGLVSPDFHAESIACFVTPVLQQHDSNAFRYVLYANGSQQNTVSLKLKTMADEWRGIGLLETESAIQQIMQDQVDILIDLSGHTQGNRMDIFARRAAPIQASYLGYPATTGLDTMDYRITDLVADPRGQTTFWHTERLIQMPGCHLCFVPAESGPLARVQTSEVTFGAVTKLPKLTTAMIQTWSQILLAVPGSRLLLKSDPLTDSGISNRIRGLFQNAGVPAERLIFRSESMPGEHSESDVDTLRMIDVLLDTFPYNGAMTTMEALWMGVPVITLAGQSSVSRTGASILTALGQENLIADNPESYRALAIELASNQDHRQNLARALRSMMAASPLTDTEKFRTRFENALNAMVRFQARQ